MTQLELFDRDPTARMLDELDDLLRWSRDRRRRRHAALAAARCALSIDPDHHLPMYRRVTTVRVSEKYL